MNIVKTSLTILAGVFILWSVDKTQPLKPQNPPADAAPAK